MPPIQKTSNVLTLLSCLLLAACSTPSDNAREFRVAGSSPPNSPWSMQWQRFAENLAAAPDISLEPALYVHGQLGDPERSIQSLRRGRVQLGGFPLSAAAALVPEVALLHAPFVFSSEAEVDHVIDHFLQPAFNELFEAQGVTVLNWTEAGWNHLYASTPIRTPEALVNFPIRTQPTLGSRVMFSTLGADVRPIPYSDLLSSLQTGLVRGADGNLVMYFAAGLVDEAPYLTLTGHVFEVGVILANSAWWQSRSEAERTAIHAALGPRTRLRAEVAAQADALMNAAVTAQRVEVHTPDASELRAWRAVGPRVRQRLVQEIGGEAARIDALITAGQRSFATADRVQ
ncbi:MAG: TRAP transporter substrate-binding protein [Gammaproteobacteria bacterium]|nr:TRAP transporter substrate-binding protein [Gammaproteobacteria bacterium]